MPSFARLVCLPFLVSRPPLFAGELPDDPSQACGVVVLYSDPLFATPGHPYQRLVIPDRLWLHSSCWPFVLVIPFWFVAFHLPPLGDACAEAVNLPWLRRAVFVALILFLAMLDPSNTIALYLAMSSDASLASLGLTFPDHHSLSICHFLLACAWCIFLAYS